MTDGAGSAATGTSGETATSAETATAPPTVERRVPIAQVFAALVLVGLSLRTQVLVIGPLVGEVKSDLGMTHGVAGLLGSIPVLCMAVLAPLGPVLGGVIGPRLGAALCVAFVGGFGLARSVAPDATTALVATVGIGVGMAVVGPILAMAVRQRTPDHPAAGTGAYVVGMVVGATLTAAVALPLSAGLGGWRGTFAAISAAGLISLAAWLWLMPRDARAGRAAPRLPRLPWRRPSAWLLGAIFGTQSIIFYGSITWLASLYVERGWRPTDAAGLVALVTGMGLFATLAVPLFADRVGTRRGQLAMSGLIAIVGLLVIGLTPGEPSGSVVTLVGTALVGFGIGLYFPLVLTLPVDIAADPEEAASISALMLLVGYVIASTSPVVLGLVRDATGGFEGIVAIFVVVAISMVAFALPLSPGRLERAAAARPTPPPAAP